MSHLRNQPWPPEVRARAMKLRGLGLRLVDVQELTGVPKQTIHAWEMDPDGSKARARKDAYRGTCEHCGAPTCGSNGIDGAPSKCRECTLFMQHALRRWTQAECVAAIRRFAERYGRQPAPRDFLTGGSITAENRARFYRDGDYPGGSVLQREFGSWAAGLRAAGFEAREFLTPFRNNPEAVQRAVAMYRSGESVEAIARSFGVTSNAVWLQLERAGEPRTQAFRWTHEAVIEALRDEARRCGHTPKSTAFRTRAPYVPTIVRLFGSWNAALEAAGLPLYRRTRRVSA